MSRVSQGVTDIISSCPLIGPYKEGDYALITATRSCFYSISTLRRKKIVSCSSAACVYTK